MVENTKNVTRHNRSTRAKESVFPLCYCSNDILDTILSLIDEPQAHFWAITLSCKHLHLQVQRYCLETWKLKKHEILCDPGCLVRTESRFLYALKNVPSFKESLCSSYEIKEGKHRSGSLVHRVGGPFTLRLLECIPISYFKRMQYEITPRVNPCLLTCIHHSRLYDPICYARRTVMLDFIVGLNERLAAALRVCGLPAVCARTPFKRLPKQHLSFAFRCGVAVNQKTLGWIDIACRGVANKRHGVITQRYQPLNQDHVSELFHKSILHIHGLLKMAARYLAVEILRWVRSQLCQPSIYPGHPTNVNIVDVGPFMLRKTQQECCLTAVMREEYTQCTYNRHFEGDIHAIEETSLAVVGIALESCRCSKNSDRAAQFILCITEWAGADAWSVDNSQIKPINRSIIHLVDLLYVHAIKELTLLSQTGAEPRTYAALLSLLELSSLYYCNAPSGSLVQFLKHVLQFSLFNLEDGFDVFEDGGEFEARPLVIAKLAHAVIKAQHPHRLQPVGGWFQQNYLRLI